MSNGAQAAKGNAARAAASSAARGPLTDRGAAQRGAPLTELPFDDAMDADDLLEASQISQTQIIERQAETIARLERHAARDREYRTVTKVKLKEAAARLKEYRLRVEALMGDVATLEAEKKKLVAQVQAAKRKTAAAAPPPAPKKPEMVSVAVQTPWKKALRTVSVQTTVMACDKQTQVEPEVPVHKTPVCEEPLVLQERAAVAPIVMRETATSTNGDANGVLTSSTTTAASAFDAIGAAIDAELEFSDDDEDVEETVIDDMKQLVDNAPVVAREGLVPMPTVLDDAISREIDKELEFSSSSSDDSSDDESDADVEDPLKAKDKILPKDKSVDIANSGSRAPTAATPTRVVQSVVPREVTLDAVTAAIDAELASDMEDVAEDEEDIAKLPLVQVVSTSASPRKTVVALASSHDRRDALPLAMPLPLEFGPSVKPPGDIDLVSAAIDAELASNSEDEGEQADLPRRDEALLRPITNPGLALEAPTFQPVKITQTQESKKSPHSEAAESDLLCTPPVTPQVGDSSVTAAIQEDPLQILHEKSRTLSLSSDSSSSGSSDGETSLIVDPLSEQPVEIPISITQNGNNSTVDLQDKAAMPSVNPADLSPTAQESVMESKKRRESAIVPTGMVTVGEPDQKKRRRVSEDTTTAAPAPRTALISTTPASNLASTLPGKAVEDVLRSQPKLEVSGGMSALHVLAPRDLVAFKVAITLQVGEEPDIFYVTRTLSVLVKHAATILRAKNGGIDSNTRVTSNPHVLKLCKMLVKEHSQRHIGHELIVEAIVRIFRTPRTRHAIEKSVVQLTSLFQVVFFLWFGVDDLTDQSDGDDYTTDMIPEVHQALLSIRDLIVAARLKDGLVISQTENVNARVVSIATSSFRPTASVSYDKAFLAHAAAFYTTVCCALNRFDLPLVLIIDILKCHPNIKGLYCVHSIVQIDQRVLRKKWDCHGREQTSALRAAIVHILQAITYQSRDKEEMVFKESAVMLLSSITAWIDDPPLLTLGAPGNTYEMKEKIDSFAAFLWSDHITRCITDPHCDTFDLEKALELLAMFHGDGAMLQHFPIKKFLTVVTSDTTATTSPHLNARIARLIGAVARGAMRSSVGHHDTHERRTPSDHYYVDEAVRWILGVLPRDHDSNSDELSAVVWILSDLLVGFSTHEGQLKQRDEWLRELLVNLSPQHLHRLSGEALRPLRLLVTAARPVIPS